MYYTKPIFYLFVLLVLFHADFVSSQSDSKIEKLKIYANVSGFNKMYDETYKQYELNAKQYAYTLYKNLKEQYPKLTGEYESRAKKVYEKYYLEVYNKDLSTKLKIKYLELIGPHYTEEDLDRLIEFYNSPIGRKLVQINHEIVPEWSKYSSSEGNKAMADALKPMQNEIDIIIREYLNETDPWWIKIVRFIF